MSRALGLFALTAAVLFCSAPVCADQHADDAAMGRQVYNDLRSKDQIVSNSPYNHVLQQVGRRIAAAAGRQWYVERFYVIRGNQMNAFSAPGGYVFVNEGLLRNVDNADELANVLGHETAHLVLGHVGARAQQQKRRNLVYNIGHFFTKTASQGAQNTFNAATQAGNYTFLGFTRDQEYQADQTGAMLAMRAGYDPWGAIWFFQETERMYGDAGYEQYVQQHPSTKDRIARLERYFAANPRTFGRWPRRLTNRSGLPMT
ncbi:MAG TPA: M48 family metalloprotease [Candidatus Baltobacteraceae bacterium]|nr:M48 family metalloprotease [Candidatus Baltobacteraceae bacterium]